MAEKATLYFVVTKVIAPKNSRFHLLLFLNNIKIKLNSPKSRSLAYTIPYKIKKDVNISSVENSKFNIQINFYEGERIIANGSVDIYPKYFININAIEPKQYNLNVPNMNDIYVFVGMTIIPFGGICPSDYDIYGDSAKVISAEGLEENIQAVPIHPSSNSQTEAQTELVESESGKKHKRKKGTSDKECIMFESQSGNIHRRHHTHQYPTDQIQSVGEEEIVQSESGNTHRRKKGTKDTKSVTFTSEEGHVHRKKRRHISQETENQEQYQQQETEINNRQNQKSEDDVIVESESGKKHRRKKGTGDIECITFESQNGNIHRRHHTHHPQQNTPQAEGEEEIVQSESGNTHRRKKGTKDTKSVTFTSESGHVHRRRRHHTQQETQEQPEEVSPAPTENVKDDSNETQSKRRRRSKKEKEENDNIEVETVPQKEEHHHRKRRSHSSKKPDES